MKTDLEVKPLLGDTWSRGPNYHVKAGQTIDIYPHFVAQHGTVTKQYPSFVSTKLPSTRGIWVYLPPTYVENSESRFGVLYMHDAQNLFDPALAFGGNEWKVDETIDAGAEDGSIRETIVVGVENTAARIDELTPTPDATEGGAGGKADQYLSMIIDEIKPTIDKDLRTIPAREQTGIMGSSLGGLVSAYAGVRRADVFGLVGEMSPSTWWDNTEILGEVSTTPTRPAKPVRVYVDSGDSGAEGSQDDVTNTTELAARYRTRGLRGQQGPPPRRAGRRPAQRDLLGAAPPRRAPFPARRAPGLKLADMSAHDIDAETARVRKIQHAKGPPTEREVRAARAARELQRWMRIHAGRPARVEAHEDHREAWIDVRFSLAEVERWLEARTPSAGGLVAGSCRARLTSVITVWCHSRLSVRKLLPGVRLESAARPRGARRRR